MGLPRQGRARRTCVHCGRGRQLPRPYHDHHQLLHGRRGPRDFGPYTPGFRVVPYGDLDAMRAAIDETTVAVLIEPIQGEAGVLVPPLGYLPGVRALCTQNNVLLLADEVQSGLGRTGDTFACDHEGVVPDMYILGKALGGGVVPVSAVVSRAEILGVLRPGEHGSTFGGNPLACAVGIAVVDLLSTGEFQQRARDLGAVLHARLEDLIGKGVTAVRGRGLWAGVDIDPSADDRPRGLRTADRQGHPRQGHARLHDPPGPAPGRHRGRGTPGRRPPAGNPLLTPRGQAAGK